MDKLFITDLDGTALGGGHEPYARFPDCFSQFLDSLVDHDFSWGINTTWDIGGQWDLVNTSSVNSKPEYLMAEFGLRMANINAGKPELIQPYTSNMEKKLSEFQSRKFNPIIRDISNRFDTARMMYYGHLLSFEPASYVDLAEFKQFLQKYFDDRELICKMEGNMFAARPAFMNKAEPFSEIDLPPDQIIVAGDEITDLAMMQPEVAKYCICPANAAPQVKEHVAKHNGIVSDLPYGAGVIQAFKSLARQQNWSIV